MRPSALEKRHKVPKQARRGRLPGPSLFWRLGEGLPHETASPKHLGPISPARPPLTGALGGPAGPRSPLGHILASTFAAPPPRVVGLAPTARLLRSRNVRTTRLTREEAEVTQGGRGKEGPLSTRHHVKRLGGGASGVLASSARAAPGRDVAAEG